MYLSEFLLPYSPLSYRKRFFFAEPFIKIYIVRAPTNNLYLKFGLDYNRCV